MHNTKGLFTHVAKDKSFKQTFQESVILHLKNVEILITRSLHVELFTETHPTTNELSTC